MAITRSALTDTDIRTLVRGGSADERSVAAHKICRTIDKSAATMTEEERRQAHEILRIMACDAAELVRRALAVTLRASTVVPRDVANRLARDIESVALPILNFSPVFTDDDLAEIVRLGGNVRQAAIARRPQLSATVTQALAEHADARAMELACANPGAAFTERTLQLVMDRFNASEAVLDAMAYREALPLSVSERLIDMVGAHVREHLVSRHALSPATALEVALGSTERATMDLVDQAGRAADVKSFVAHLHRSGRLTPSLMLRALAQGHMAFFEWSVAELAGVPHHRTWLMIHDAGPLGLRAIYERAGLPMRLFDVFRSAVDTFHSFEFEGGPRDRARFQQRLLERFLTLGANAPKEDVDYLLDRLDKLAKDAEPQAEPLTHAA